MSTRTKGSRGSRGRSRLAIRYFDDRVLLTDTHAWAYYRVPSVSYEFTTAEEREALATNITVALAAIRMAGRRGAPAHRAPVLPGARVGDRPGRDLGRGPGLAGVPGADLPARLGQGLLGQGDLPRRPAGPARRARAALRRRVLPVPRRVRPRREGTGNQGRGGRLGGGRQVDGQRRAARPGAERERAGRQARVGRRDRLADPAHAHADGGGAAAVRDQAQALGPGRDRHPLRGADPQRPNPAAPGAHVRGKSTPLSCRLPVFPM